MRYGNAVLRIFTSEIHIHINAYNFINCFKRNSFEIFVKTISYLLRVTYQLIINFKTNVTFGYVVKCVNQIPISLIYIVGIYYFIGIKILFSIVSIACVILVVEDHFLQKMEFLIDQLPSYFIY